MTFDPRDFRQALGCFPTGVVVVTALGPEVPIGITVNSFASVSLDPPLVLWCMYRNSCRYAAFAAAERFTISVLGSGHRDISARLARPGEHKLDGLPLVETVCGPPGLADALAVLECRRETVHDGGDHVIIVGRVEQLSWEKDGRPLVYFRGGYGTVAEGHHASG